MEVHQNLEVVLALLVLIVFQIYPIPSLKPLDTTPTSSPKIDPE